MYLTALFRSRSKQSTIQLEHQSVPGEPKLWHQGRMVPKINTNNFPGYANAPPSLKAPPVTTYVNGSLINCTRLDLFGTLIRPLAMMLKMIGLVTLHTGAT